MPLQVLAEKVRGNTAQAAAVNHNARVGASERGTA